MLATQQAHGVIRCYFFAQQAGTGRYMLIEAITDTLTSQLSATFKCTDAATLAAFQERFRQALARWLQPRA